MENNLENKIDIHERIAILEAHREADSIVLADIQTKVNGFHDEMIRYRGWFGAFTFIGSSVIVAITLFKDWFLSHWR